MEDKPVDIEVLRKFSPLDGLKRENLHALSRKTRLQELDTGRVLFKEGESDKRTIYLVERRNRTACRRSHGLDS